MKIRYKNKIILNQHQEAEWTIDTDRGDRYKMFGIAGNRSPWTDWWGMQDQSELRVWQKDVMRDFGSLWSDLTPFVVYKPMQGHSQPHDVCVSHSEQEGIWLLSTEKDFWIVRSQYGNIEFDQAQSLGSVLKIEDRQSIYLVRDGVYHKYNNEIR